jgi:diguanylate cyclase (GGDEF)-like protein
MNDQHASQMSLAEQIDALNLQAEALFFSDCDQALRLFEEAGRLAQSGEYATEPYRAGLAGSLAGRALVNLEAEPAMAVKQCLEVLRLFESQPPTSALALAQFNLGAVYQIHGDYAVALEWKLKSLQTSRALGLPVREAMALDAIALVHTAMGESEKALREQQTALELIRASSDETFAPNILNNLAMTFLFMGNYASALELGLQALELNRKLGTVRRDAYLTDTVGQILIAMGDYARAEAHFQQALQSGQFADREVVKPTLLTNLGRVYLAQKNYTRAEDQVNQALVSAVEGNFPNEEADCHRLLADIYEKKGELARALEHFKKFYDLEKSLTLEDSARRVSVLNAQQEFENARRDAEIYRLRTVELQREIDERTRLEVKLTQLATTDELTGIHNRRYFFERSQTELNRAIRYRRSLTVLMVDVDHFKKVNDTFGHTTGDQVLAGLSTVIRKTLRASDILGRYGGEEFCLLLPDTNAKQGFFVAERIRQSVELHPFETAAGSLSITISIGLACLSSSDPNQSTSLEQLINEADHALYKAKQDGRNRVAVVF